jgi:hypothetical protein
MEMKHQVTKTRLRKTMPLQGEIAAFLVFFSVARVQSEDSALSPATPANQRVFLFSSRAISATYKRSFSLPTTFPRRPPPKLCQASTFLYIVVLSEERLSSVHFRSEDFLSNKV